MKNYIYGIYNITAASIDRYLQLNAWKLQLCQSLHDGLYE